MEDSTLGGWTTPPQLPAGSVSATRRVAGSPGGPAKGTMGEFRSLTQATDETIKFAARTWEQREADEFERDGRTWTEPRRRRRYTLVRGNPLLAPDAVSGRSVLRPGQRALALAPRRPARGAEPADRHDGRDAAGAVMRPAARHPGRGHRDVGERTSAPARRDAWGCRDWAQVEARYQPLGKSRVRELYSLFEFDG